MGNPTNAGGGGPRVLPPAGLTKSRCIQVLELGTHKEKFKNEEKLITKIRLTFELPELKHVFDEAKGEQPFTVSQNFTKSMNEKANLRKFVESWLGRGLTKDETEKGFDCSLLLNKGAMVNVIHKPNKTDATKINAVISAIMPMPAGSKMVKAINPLVDFFFGGANQWTEYEKIGEYYQKYIAESPEFQEQKVKTNYKGVAATVTAEIVVEEPEEDQF